MSKCPSCWNHAHQGNYIECPNVQTGQRREGNKINFSNVQAAEVNGVMDWSLIVQKSKLLNSKALWNGHWLSECPSCWGQRHERNRIKCPNNLTEGHEGIGKWHRVSDNVPLYKTERWIFPFNDKNAFQIQKKRAEIWILRTNKSLQQAQEWKWR